MIICDRCEAKLETGEGYAVYSEAGFEISDSGASISTTSSLESRLGSILLCESCANGLFTKEVWDSAKKMTVEVDMTDGLRKAKREAQSVHNSSVAMRAKRRGLNPSQAKEEARKIAQLWWTDKEAAVQKLKGQVIECFIATACYGSAFHEDVKLLRLFRDKILVPNAIGAVFLSLYYRYSPKLARKIKNSPFLKTIVRTLVVFPVVTVIKFTNQTRR